MADVGISWVTIGVPDPDAVGAYYEEFGLIPSGPAAYGTTAAPSLLRIVEAPFRQITEIGVTLGQDQLLGDVATRARVGGLPVIDGDEGPILTDPATGIRIVLGNGADAPGDATARAAINMPGRRERLNVRGSARRSGPARVRRLGHVVIGSPDPMSTVALFVDVLGFRVSDRVGDDLTFMRCSTDHHNVLVIPAPVPYLHHTAWEVDDIDEIARGALHLIERDASRHVWGFGRHQLGSNYFWYLRDPAGNFTEYFADMDCITDPDAWEPMSLSDARQLRDWPLPPREFVRPADMASLVEARR